MVSIKGHEASAIALMCFYLEKSDPSIMKIVKCEFEDEKEQKYRTIFEFNGTTSIISRFHLNDRDEQIDEVIID